LVLPSGDAAQYSLGPLAAMLKSDGRWANMRIAQPHPLLVTVRAELGVVVLGLAQAFNRVRKLFSPFLNAMSEARGALVLLGVPNRPVLDEVLQRGLVATVSAKPSSDELAVAVHNAFELLGAKQRCESRGKWLDRYRYELGELIEIAQALTTEQDIDKLLALILEKSRFITGADAGSIYVVEGDDPEIARRTLHFKLSQNDSLRFDAGEFSMPISRSSMAGYVALKRGTLNIPDVYDLPADAPYSLDKSFDEAHGYRTKSMLCTALLSKVGDVIGVIQLINKKREPTAKLLCPADFDERVVAFDDRSVELLSTLGSQAGIALENAILYAENQRMLEGFVRASVEAIEQRDPSTSGHSRRVAELSVALARAVERQEGTYFREVCWSDDELLELEYASLLHDFGKIGVRENVLVKAKKLYPHELESIRHRFAVAARAAESDLLQRQLRAALRGAQEAELQELEKELEGFRSGLAEGFSAIMQANEPAVLAAERFSVIEQIARETYLDHEGQRQPLLNHQDVLSLSIPRGSLTPGEVDQIRSHVSHTFEFLSQIPWGKKFRRVAQIAAAHHERLDGTGYPKRLHSSEIPLQSKIMAISDIFDALTAADRPYKKAVPLTKALNILNAEAKDGHVDSELVRVFVESRLWEKLSTPPRD